MMAKIFGYKVVEPLDSYLGSQIEVGCRDRSVKQIIVNKLEGRLQSWKANLLSLAGRVTLIKIVISQIPIYYLSYFKLTTKEARTLEEL